MELQFVKTVARTNDPTYAAAKAGFANVSAAASKLMRNPIVAEATREEAQRLAREKGGFVGIYTLMSIALDDKQPAGARVTAAKVLADKSGIGVEDGDGTLDLHEMNGEQLAAYAAKLQRQADAAARAQADRARPVIDAEPSGSGVFE